MLHHVVNKRLLIPLVLIGLLITACGTAASSPELDEAPVDAPAPGDALVDAELPEEIEQPPAQQPATGHAVYPDAEFINSNTWGVLRVHRYITEDPIDDVVRFYQEQYADADYFADLSNRGTSFELAYYVPDGLTYEEELEFIDALEVFRVTIQFTDELFFEVADMMGASMTWMPQDILAEIPENVTMIEVFVP